MLLISKNKDDKIHLCKRKKTTYINRQTDKVSYIVDCHKKARETFSEHYWQLFFIFSLPVEKLNKRWEGLLRLLLLNNHWSLSLDG